MQIFAVLEQPNTIYLWSVKACRRNYKVLNNSINFINATLVSEGGKKAHQKHNIQDSMDLDNAKDVMKTEGTTCPHRKGLFSTEKKLSVTCH